MASVVGICNNALIKIGEETITSLTEDSKAARLCNQIYEQTRDSLLRSHIWNFAVKRLELAENTTTPLFGFGQSFALPSDCLRVLCIEDSDIYPDYVYQIEGRNLLTDESAAKIKYIARIEDPNEFDLLFTETLSARLAFELAYPLAESNTLADLMHSLFKEKLAEARSIDGQEGTPPQIIAREWTDARL